MLLMTAPVAVRRRWPLAAGSVVLGATAVLALVAGYSTALAQGIGWLCALYAIAVWTDTRRFLAGIGVLVVTNLVSLAGPHAKVGSVAIFTWAPILAMVLVRGAVRERQLRADALAARAELLERERELRAHEAVAEERARIARELHDLVAHNVSVMVVQAGRRAPRPGSRAGVDRARRWPRSSRPAARRWSRRAGCSACCGRDGRAAADSSRSRASTSIDVLVEQVERAGLPVTLAVEGEPVAAARRARPVRLPDRAGGPDQRAQARRPGARRGRAALRAAARSTSRSATTAAARRTSTATERATA